LDVLTSAGQRLAQSRPSVAAAVGSLGRLLAAARAEQQLEPAAL
jgi:hypothetical protein